MFKELRACQICAERFSKTHTAHAPRPVLQAKSSARILIAGQAPGARAHETGRPFTDASGDRLRDWLGVSVDMFYDESRIAIVPMAFCFPGYDTKGNDLPPPKVCAKTWRDEVLAQLPDIELTLLVGAYAQAWHLKDRRGVRERVADWRRYAPKIFVLPHPSWRNTAWLNKTPWFSADVLPALQQRVREVLE